MSDESPPESDDGDSLSSRLREARDHAAQTRAVLAERSGVSTPTIFRLERGDYDDGAIQVRIIGALALALGVEPGWLAYGSRCDRPGWVKARDRRRS